MFAGEFYVAIVFDVGTVDKESACFSTCFQEASYRMTGVMQPSWSRHRMKLCPSRLALPHRPKPSPEPLRPKPVSVVDLFITLHTAATHARHPWIPLPQHNIFAYPLPPSMSAQSQRVLAGTTTKRVPTMRPPSGRPGPSRAQTATPIFGARAPSRASSRERTPKRIAQSEMGLPSPGGEETNINVVVRCRGRNDREVRENSGVVVQTNGVKGTQVELSMGPSAVSNKTYQFDKVFSSAADQNMVYDEVVAPILDEVIKDMSFVMISHH